MTHLAWLRRRFHLLAIALAMELVYLLYFVRQFPLLRYYQQDVDMATITGHAHAAFFIFIGLFVLLFLFFGVAVWLARGERDGSAIWLVLGVGAVLALTAAFIYPITAIDVYNYVDENLIMVQYHQNPIFTPPAAIFGDPLMLLSDGWSGSGAPYGPLGLVVDALPTLVAGRNLLATLILLKLLFSALALGNAYIAYRIVRRLRPALAVTAAVLIAWNPLILFEIGANAHNDIVMMFFAMLGLLSMVEEEYTLGPVLLTASVLVKYATVFLIPLFLLYGLSRQPDRRRALRYLVTTGAAMLALAAISYVPFWRGLETVTRLVSQNQRYLTSFSTNFTHATGGAVGVNTAALIGRILFVFVFVYALWLSTRGPEQLLRACFLVMFGFLALGATSVETWYALWPAVLAAAVPCWSERIAAWLLACGTVLYAGFFAYIWWWWGLSQDGLNLVDSLSYLALFGPALIVLVAGSIMRSELRGRLMESAAEPSSSGP